MIVRLVFFFFVANIFFANSDALYSEPTDHSLALRVMNGSGNPTSLSLPLISLQIDVKVLGNIASTGMEMRFGNNSDRSVDTKLQLPLDDDQVISGFALEVNGRWHEGVVVPKSAIRGTDAAAEHRNGNVKTEVEYF